MTHVFTCAAITLAIIAISFIPEVIGYVRDMKKGDSENDQMFI